MADKHLASNGKKARKDGRFISEDPIGLSGGTNLYTFAHNDPINGSDPSGTCDYYTYYFQGSQQLGGFPGSVGPGQPYTYTNGQGFLQTSYCGCTNNYWSDTPVNCQPPSQPSPGGGYWTGKVGTSPVGSVPPSPKPSPKNIACNRAATMTVFNATFDYLGLEALVQGAGLVKAAFGNYATNLALNGKGYGIPSTILQGSRSQITAVANQTGRDYLIGGPTSVAAGDAVNGAVGTATGNYGPWWGYVPVPGAATFASYLGMQQACGL